MLAEIGPVLVRDEGERVKALDIARDVSRWSGPRPSSPSTSIYPRFAGRVSLDRSIRTCAAPDLRVSPMMVKLLL